MPHLEVVYIYHQAFWCFFLFALLYFTISKPFCKKFSSILNGRENYIKKCLRDAEDMIKSAELIEEKMNLSRHELEERMKSMEADATRSLEEIRKKRLDKFHDNLEKRRLKHKLYLDEVENQILIESSQNIKEQVQKILLNYFAK